MLFKRTKKAVYEESVIKPVAPIESKIEELLRNNRTDFLLGKISQEEYEFYQIEIDQIACRNALPRIEEIERQVENESH